MLCIIQQRSEFIYPYVQDASFSADIHHNLHLACFHSRGRFYSHRPARQMWMKRLLSCCRTLSHSCRLLLCSLRNCVSRRPVGRLVSAHHRRAVAWRCAAATVPRPSEQALAVTRAHHPGRQPTPASVPPSCQSHSALPLASLQDHKSIKYFSGLFSGTWTWYFFYSSQYFSDVEVELSSIKNWRTWMQG